MSTGTPGHCPSPAPVLPADAPSGLVYASLAYAGWGLLPLYFQLLAFLGPVEIVIHRVLFSLMFLLPLALYLGRAGWVRELLRRPRVLALYALTALLIASNWLIFVWAVNSGQVVEASLGYFINPIVVVLAGALILKERLRPRQWAAVALAAAGVAVLTIGTGQLPLIALALTASFATYGVLRKLGPLGALEGLTLETAWLFPLALLGFGGLLLAGQAVALEASGGQWALIALAGPLTALPLLGFAAGARRIRLATLGLLQYISPTLQLGIGVLLGGEAFDGARQLGFGIIWAALALYSADSWWAARGRS